MSGGPAAPDGPGLAGQRLVCLSSLPWDGFPTSRHHLARILAETNEVLFVDPPAGLGRPRQALRTLLDRPAGRRLPAGDDGVLRLTPPPHLPYGGPLRRMLTTGANQRGYAAAVRRALAGLGWERPVLWNVFPVYSAARLVAGAPESPQLLHMTDSLWDYPWYGAAYERALRICVDRSPFTVGSSPEIVARLEGYGRPSRLLEHGVDADSFRPVAEGAVAPEPALQDRRRPRIGLVGSIDFRMDVALVASLTTVGSVTLVGPVARGATAPERQDLAALERSGCHLEGMVPHDRIGSWLAGFDVAVVPYRTTPLVQRSNPLKLLEYLAAGLPVVSVDIPAARRHAPLARLAADPGDFVAQVRTAGAALVDASEEERAGARRRRHQWAEQHSWRSRARQLAGWMAELVPDGPRP